MKSTILLMPLALLFTVSSYGSTMCSAADVRIFNLHDGESAFSNHIA